MTSYLKLNILPFQFLRWEIHYDCSYSFHMHCHTSQFTPLCQSLPHVIIPYRWSRLSRTWPPFLSFCFWAVFSFLSRAAQLLCCGGKFNLPAPANAFYERNQDRNANAYETNRVKKIAVGKERPLTLSCTENGA